MAENFNLPIKLSGGKWYTNERLVEMPFVYQALFSDATAKRALEFGCTRSWLAVQLAALGYEVTAVDLRPYQLAHPGLTFRQMNILDLEAPSGFDVITAVSVIEHIGTGAYGETAHDGDLLRVVERLIELLRPSGRLIITVPIGMSYQDEFLRSFTVEEVLKTFRDGRLNMVTERYYRRRDRMIWQEVNPEAMISIDNSRDVRGPTGVNGVGCFVWERLPMGRESL
jgi:2-polyprenyl-3-methyl-5-hydroxy-6-metoxy-1,4-benzoquinol methylase